MTKLSAGILVYRRHAGHLQVFLVHPGGPFWAKKDDGAWSIPKGECRPDEDPLQAAKREFFEETGIAIEGNFAPLLAVKQRSGKIISAWAVEGDIDAERLRSNVFQLEWPPKSGRLQEFPEVDRAAWFGLASARVKLITGQVAFLDELASLLGETAGPMEKHESPTQGDLF